MNDLVKIKKVIEERKRISSWLDEMGIEYYTINDDLTVDVGCGVNLTRKGLEEIPIQFREVVGGFDCSDNSLRSTKGFPIVADTVFCEDNMDVLYRPKDAKYGTFYNYRNHTGGNVELLSWDDF